MKTQIGISPKIAVFARNHRDLLKSAASRNKKQPEQSTTFHSSVVWRTAHKANMDYGPIKIYLAPNEGDKKIEFEAIIHRIKLNPKPNDAETKKLLRFSLKETKEEGLWGKTLYVINHCKKIPSPFSMTELIKVSNHKPISEGYIRAYSIVYEHHATTANDMVDGFLSPEEIKKTQTYPEGAVKKILVNIYERNPDARKKCIEHFGYSCIVCGFDFEKKYGTMGKRFIHVHHLIPLSKIEGRYKIDPIKDLRPICPNCHAMIHISKENSLSIAQLKKKMK